MLKINIDKMKPEPVTMKARAVKVDTLFRDGHGDLHLRTAGGCVSLANNDCIAIYSGEELDEGYDFFNECTPVKGNVIITVDLE